MYYIYFLIKINNYLGHFTIATRKNGQLLICEAEAKGFDWPNNGIQCNPYDLWLRMAKAADYNIIWLPLDRSI